MYIFPHHYCNRIQTNAVLDVVVTESIDPPIEEPVTLAQAKAWLRMENVSLDDAIITALITEGRQWVEKRCGISIVTKDIIAILEVMNEIEIPYGPIPDTSAIAMTNSDGEVVDNFTVVGINGGYPVLRGYGMVNLAYTAGMTTVDQEIRGAILNYVAFAYENRGDEIEESDSPFAKLARKKSNLYKRTIGF